MSVSFVWLHGIEHFNESNEFGLHFSTRENKLYFGLYVERIIKEKLL